MEQRITLITLGVSDLNRSTQFYADVFGWKPEPWSTEGVSFYKLRGLHLALFPTEELAKDAQTTLTMGGSAPISLAYNVDSEAAVDETFHQLVKKGAKSVKHPEKVFWGGYCSYIADPDDYLWEIAYNPFLKDE